MTFYTTNIKPPISYFTSSHHTAYLFHTSHSISPHPTSYTTQFTEHPHATHPHTTTHTSQLIPQTHTINLTPQTSRHKPHAIPHKSQLTPLTSYHLIHYSFHYKPHTTHLTPQTSHPRHSCISSYSVQHMGVVWHLEVAPYNANPSGPVLQHVQ